MGIGIGPRSYAWGFDRGTPVPRYFRERFMEQYRADVQGQCLEFQADDYTTCTGGSAMKRLDILHIDDANRAATIVADLSKSNSMPSNQFDCIICTYVLHIIVELDAVLAELHRILKPGGVLLVAVPLACMYDPSEAEQWRFTPHGLARLLKQAFGDGQVIVHAYGNSLTSGGELLGLVAEEFTESELAAHDERSAQIVCARAVKRRADGNAT
jgi:SAM-dependent methyltransferase